MEEITGPWEETQGLTVSFGRLPLVFVAHLRPGNQVLRMDSSRGGACADIPVMPKSRPGPGPSPLCDHCMNPPRNLIGPVSLCRFHGYYFLPRTLSDTC